MDASHLTANVIKLTQAKMVSILSDTKKNPILALKCIEISAFITSH